jgi:hypothetical protein
MKEYDNVVIVTLEEEDRESCVPCFCLLIVVSSALCCSCCRDVVTYVASTSPLSPGTPPNYILLASRGRSTADSDILEVCSWLPIFLCA